MSYRIKKARQLVSQIENLEKDIKLTQRALVAAKDAKGSRDTIEEFSSKEAKLQKQLLKTKKKYTRYADENLKISDLPKVFNSQYYEEEEYEDDEE